MDVDRESAFPELDGEPFTGNIYEVTSVEHPLDADFAGPSLVFDERFEIGDDDQPEFVRWLEGEHLDDLAGLPGVAGRGRSASTATCRPLPLRPLRVQGQPHDPHGVRRRDGSSRALP